MIQPTGRCYDSAVTYRLALAAAVLLSVLLAGQARADERSLVVLFGPTSEEAGQVAAHAVAGTAHDWLQIAGAGVELRRPGVSEGQELTRYMQAKDLEQAFLDAARGSRQTDMMGFLNALDKAGYALARRHGKRLLIAILESPLPAAVAGMKGGAEEVQNRLNQTVDFCRSNAVNIIVLDPSMPMSKDPFPALKTLAGATGGALLRDPKALNSSVLVIAPVETAVSTNAPSSPPAASAPVGLPVSVRLIRIQPKRANDVNTDLGPMDAFLLVECPLNALEFQVDNGGKFLVHARVSQTVRSAEGKTVWQSKKEITLKEPVKKMPSRRAGSFYYMRQLQLPAGQYTVEAAVDDLIAGKSGTVSQPVHATDSGPGLDVSDAMFVRPMNEAADRFEADQVLSYDGKALAPMLDPVFPANQPFELRLYFIIYPDIRGAKPEISLEILRDGKAVGRSQMAFNDEIRNTTTENGTMGSKGEQKHEFPYLTDMRDATFDAGQYEARVTIRQGRGTVTRVAPFRVVRAPAGQ
jgi:hypothetical protein